MKRFFVFIMFIFAWLGLPFNAATNFIGPCPVCAEDAEAVIATVQCAPIRESVITRTITAYGTVIPSPGAVKSISLPFQCEITGVFVNEGEVIHKGDRLLEASPGPDTVLVLKEAKIEYHAAQKKQKVTRERLSLRLATNQDLAAAQKALDQAKVRLKYLENQGASKAMVITARRDGVISRLFVGPGAVLQAGSPFLEVTQHNSQEVRLAVEAEDVSLLEQGQEVTISLVNRSEMKPIPGKIRAISSMVNPSTRLLDVFVAIPDNSSALLNEYVRGGIKVQAHVGLLVPRKALLPEGNHFVLFTVKNGRAAIHHMEPGLTSGDDIEISGEGVFPGDMAVALGNYELKDGMAVSVESLK